MNTPAQHKVQQANGGVALILSLLFVVLLTVLVVEFAYEAQVEASYTLNSQNEFQARLAARSAVHKGIAVLEIDKLQSELGTEQGSSPADSRFSAWALPGEFEPLNDAVMRATITDEYSKINLNALVDYSTGDRVIREQLRYALIELFTQRASAVEADVAPETLVDSIIDWLDEDDEVDADGAESDFYQSADPPYPCKNGPMDSIEELLLIKGMSPELYFGAADVDPPQLPLSEYLTVHGDWLGRINPNTVQIDYDSGISEVLSAYCIGWEQAGLVEQVHFDQMVQDMLNIEDEYNTYQKVEDLAPYVEHMDQLVPVEEGTRRPGAPRANQPQTSQDTAQAEAEADVLRQMFTVYSHAFRIYGDALVDDVMVRHEAYVLRVPQDPSTLEWPTGTAVLPVPNPVPSGLELPQEFYRILEWKVIQ